MKKKIVLIATFILLIGQNVSSNTVHVIDGDTIKIGNKKIRFSGIDAPELNQYCFKKEKKILCGVCSINKGDTLKKGDRFGIIRFGSRVDLYFENYKIMVKKNQKSIGGETIIAKKNK